MNEEELLVLEVDTSQPVQSIKTLREELKRAKDDMLKAGEGTKEYADALQKAANAQHAMREINEQVRASAADLGVVLQNTTSVLTGVAGGFAAVQGISALMGVENDKLKETFVKLQATMAIVQGLQGLEGMGKALTNLGTILKQTEVGTKVLTAAQKAWNYVMSMNPVFLLVTAVAALTTGIVALTNVMNANNEEEERTNRIYEQRLQLLNDINTNTDYQVRLMRAAGKSEKEINDYELEASQQRLLDLRREMDLISKWDKTVKEMREVSGKYGSLKKAREALPELEKIFDEEAKKYRKLQEDKNIIDAQILKSTEDAKKKEEEARVNANKKIREEEKKHNEQLLKDKEEASKKEAELISQNILAMQEYSQEQFQRILEFEASKQEALANNQRVFIEQELEILNQKYNAFDNLDRLAYGNSLISQGEYQMALLDNEVRYNEELLANTNLTEAQRIELEANAAEARKRIAELEAQAKAAAAYIVSDAFSAAADLIGKETAAGKALAIAGATISTYQSAVDAYKSVVGIPIVGPTLAPVAAGTAIAVGLKNVKEIIKVKVPKSQGAGGQGIQAPATPQPPAILNRIEAVRNVQTPAEVDLQSQPVRAYVVESDITNTQNRISGIKDEASY